MAAYKGFVSFRLELPKCGYVVEVFNTHLQANSDGCTVSNASTSNTFIRMHKCILLWL